MNARIRLGLTIVAIAFLMTPCTFAHTSLERYVRETFFISLSAEHVDIRVHFTFPSALSLAERLCMDHDGDGVIAKEERQAYLDDVDAQAKDQLRLLVNGRVATLITLEDPSLDLQGAPGVEAHPHELRLAYFARIPQGFGLDSTIVLDSELWCGMPLMVSVSTDTAEGIRTRSRTAQGLVPPIQDGAPTCITEMRCTQWKPADNKQGR
ncbi:MAG: hypothetical protein KBC05_16730 [Candidatus Hydrogenedentes bacterium]|nr:hypothetical protein [Candidatus Hydrogenedentota bacterium]